MRGSQYLLDSSRMIPESLSAYVMIVMVRTDNIGEMCASDRYAWNTRRAASGREPRFPMFAQSRRWINCAFRRRAALRRQRPKAAVGQMRPSDFVLQRYYEGLFVICPLELKREPATHRHCGARQASGDCAVALPGVRADPARGAAQTHRRVGSACC